MAAIIFGRGYSARGWLFAAFVAVAIILGGGGTPNPGTEVLLEGIFALVAFAWIWLPRNEGSDPKASRDPLALLLIAVTVLIPVVQLVPLPPAIWSALPGREDEVAALSLVGQEHTWRPISISPSHTLASLLAIVPAAFCFYAMGRLGKKDRSLVLWTIVAMALLTAVIGAFQLTAGGANLNLYPQHHIGWVTGFQANRNAAADLLLIGFLALALTATPYLASDQRRQPLNLARGPLAALIAGTGLFILAAIAMTGSRTGIALILPAVASALLISYLNMESKRSLSTVLLFGALAAALVVGLPLLFLLLSSDTALARVVARFASLDDERIAIWKDSLYALQQYWPVGFGMGGFQDAILPAERLEFLTPAIPNRAHNEYLEIGIEAGVLGYAMAAIAACLCIAMAWRGWRGEPALRPGVVMGTTALFLIALHSVVDYPLRSMALACLTGVAAGMLVKNGASANQSRDFGRTKRVKGRA